MSGKNPARLFIVRSIACALGLLGAALLLLCIEGLVRLTFPWRNPMRLFNQPPRMTFVIEASAPVAEFDPLLGYRTRPNQRNGWWARTFFNSNKAGIRRDNEIAPKKPGQLRIACLGDSCTFGYGVPDAAFPDQPITPALSYTFLLEKTLGEMFPAKQIEVLNFGVPGYTSLHGTIQVDTVLRDFQPDILTTCYFANDVMDAGLSQRQTTPQNAIQRAQRHAAKWSQAFVHFAHWQRRYFPPEPPAGRDLPMATLEDYILHHEYIRRRCAESGVKYILLNPIFRDAQPGESVFPPTRIHQYRTALNTYARAAEIPMIEVPEVTEAHWPENDRLFLERVHPNADGHDIIARAMHAFLYPIIAARP